MNQYPVHSQEPRDITTFAEAPKVYPPYAVRIEEESRAFDLRSIWGLARRNWWILAGCFAIGVALAALYIRRATPIYQAAATIRIENTDRGANPTGFEMAAYVGGSELSTDMEILRSRMLAEEVVDTLDLQIRVTAPRGAARDGLFTDVEVEPEARPGRYVLERRDPRTFALSRFEGPQLASITIGEPFEMDGVRFTLAEDASRKKEIEFQVRNRNGAASQVRGSLRVGRPTEDTYMGILALTYEDSDRRLAATIPNAIAERFINLRRREHKRRASSTVEFLTTQLDTLSVQLRAAEDELRAFRESEGVVNLAAEGGAMIGQITAMETQRDAMLVERNALSQVVGATRVDPNADPLAPSPYRQLVSHPSLLGNPALSTMLTNLIALENERAELLERRTLQDPDVRALTDRIQGLESQLETHARTYLGGLNSQLGTMNQVVGRTSGELASIPRKEVGFIRLQQQTDLLRQTYVLLQTRLKEAEITQAVDDPNVSIVDPALTPNGPIRPNRRSTLLLGAFLGLLAGIAVAYGREFLDKTIHTRDQLREMTGVPVLGLIPNIAMGRGLQSGAKKFLPRRATANGGGNGDATPATAEGVGLSRLEPRLVTQVDRTNAVSEAYRSLRTNITFSSADRLSKVFVLTSPTPQDGKTTTCANLAITFSQQGLRVLLIDADMRRGTLHKLFHVSRTPGLSNVLVENCEFEKAIRWMQLEEGTEIDLLPTGTVPPNPAELLASSRMGWLVERMRERYDAIVIDTPPLTLVTDAAVLSSLADTLLLVARANQTEEGAVNFAMEQLRNVNAPLRGTILNDVDFKRDSKYGGYDYYGYSYDYTAESSRD